MEKLLRPALIHPQTCPIPYITMAYHSNDPSNKNVPYYKASLGDDDISPAARELLENYSHVPSEQVVAHIEEVVGHPVCNLSSPFSLGLPAHRSTLPLYSILLMLCQPA